jgi:hypothetical protein
MGKFIGGFIIIVFIYLVIKGVFGVIGSIFLSLGEFLFNSIWGLFALIAGILSIVLFYASSKTYPDVKMRGKIIKTIKPTILTMENSVSTSGNLDMHMIDMSQTNVHDFFRKLVVAINKPNPVIFKGWGNRRLELDVERARILTDYIQQTHIAFGELQELQADILFSHDKIKHLIEMKQARAAGDLDVINAQYKDLLNQYDHEQKKREILADEMRTKVKREEAINSLLELANKHWNDLKPEHRDIIISITNPSAQTSAGEYKDNSIEDLLKMQDVIKKEIENKMSKVELKNMKQKFKGNNEL